MRTDPSESRTASRTRAAVAALAAAALAAAWSCDSDRSPSPEDLPPGFWFDEREAVRSSDLGELGYADGYEAPEEDWTGLRIHDADAAYRGALVLASGHEPAAHVLTGDGSLERRWALDLHPENEGVVPRPDHPTQRTWRRVEPLPDGGLLAIHDGLCLVRLDRDSRVLWAGVTGAHHDLEVTGDEVWTLDREVRPPRPDGPERGAWTVDDGLVRVDLATGEVRQRISLLEALENSASAEIVEQALRQARSIDVPSPRGDGPPRRALDPFHANAVLLLPDDPDEVVVLLRDVGALASIDVVEGRLAWLRLGPWQGAHDPRLQHSDGLGPGG
ncbi:MAG: arylsulfotransferase family protein, partial [Planctomycetota bacterium]